MIEPAVGCIEAPLDRIGLFFFFSPFCRFRYSYFFSSFPSVDSAVARCDVAKVRTIRVFFRFLSFRRPPFFRSFELEGAR